MGTSTKNKATGKKKVVIDKMMRDYSNEPFFIKKREEAFKFLEKAGLPESFAKKK